MLTIAKMGVGQESYYLSKVAGGLEDYYSGAGEIDGRWVGRGAARLGLVGDVAGADLRALLEGSHPGDGARLAGRPGRARTPGWDLTFSTPKSVSILYGLGGPDVASQVAAAHDAAVAEAVVWLEANATVSRRRYGGEIVAVAGEGLLIAGFRHRTSRLGDPQLHTHALVANVVERQDGTWGALDSRPLYRHARTAGYLYQAVLRAELTARLGVEWTAITKGVAEIAGTSPQLREAFSKRRAQIEASMAAAGEVPSRRAAQVAAYRTRPPATPVVESSSLYARWEAEAAELGLDAADVVAVTGRTIAPKVSDADLDRIVDGLVDRDGGLCSTESTFDRAGMARAWCTRLPAGSRIDHRRIENLIEQTLADRRIVPVDPGRGPGPVIVTPEGRTRPVGVGEASWSTTELLAVEDRLLRDAAAGQRAGAGILLDTLVDAALSRRCDLGDDQAAMVRHLATSGNAVDVVVGRAGTGKTYALSAAAHLWRHAGYECVGVALAARAAAELEAGTGIESSTIAQLLADAGRCPDPVLHGRSVLVVDEASMVDTRRLATLIRMGRESGAKIVLVGDHHQLPAVEVGGGFAALVERLDPVELTNNRRQIESWERDTLARLRTGTGGPDGIRSVVADYQLHDRVRIGEDPARVRAAMALDWYQAHRRGEHAVMVALRRDDVAELNVRARALLVADGTLDDTDSITTGGRSFVAGDRVVCGRNDRRLGVHNALTGVIAAVDLASDDAAVVFTSDDGEAHSISRNYLEAGHLDHGYAMSIHKAQGATVDRCLVLGDDRLYRQAGYTALSRGRLSNDLYLIGIDDRDRYPELELEAHGADPDAEPADRAVRSLSRDGAKTLAVTLGDGHHMSGEGPRTESLGDLWRRWDHLARLVGDGPDDPTDQLEAATAELAELTVTAARPGTRPFGRWRQRLHRTERLDPADGQRKELTQRIERLAEHHRRHAEWSATNADALDEMASLAETIRWRTAQAGLDAEIERPAELLGLIGQPPVGDRSAWRNAAGAIASYDARWANCPPPSGSRTDDHAAHLEHLESVIAAAKTPAFIDVDIEPALTL